MGSKRLNFAARKVAITYTRAHKKYRQVSTKQEEQDNNFEINSGNKSSRKINYGRELPKKN